VISSHDLTELGRLCQQVLLLDNGTMSSIQLNASVDNLTQFITLQMEPCPITEVLAKFKQISGIVDISNPQKNELIIKYNSAIETKMDLKIISCINDNNWQYRQLSQGKTLEEKLFFDEV